ncbi:MAG: hypothetical protein D3923_14950 [Candidatus Electrothrix sp. AR3]|nr:hypothetical protein [Candidatus Electrothrix sp. AR3]
MQPEENVKENVQQTAPILLDGNLFKGSLAAISDNPCWNGGPSTTYVADITRHVDNKLHPNQDYEVGLVFNDQTSTYISWHG